MIINDIKNSLTKEVYNKFHFRVAGNLIIAIHNELDLVICEDLSDLEDFKSKLSELENG